MVKLKQKHIPFEKLSKRAKREQLALRRGSWGEISPVTRKAPNPKAYKRKKSEHWFNDETKIRTLSLKNRNTLRNKRNG